ncbi:MAG: hypothetical protein IPH43_07450 [Xanthomonadales bacterium]|uniref:L,D-transpeptidase family protein n=1 Tax=Dokdonella sp. TaxID=2291710 RepID=UPI002C24A424|nr:hypothetical protein [Xanthomonadales bacterium]HQV72406.1 hypothetical protein [Dokdonella sp.]MBK7012507.1 hypothetical protein [Xanthomonadales bacterium]MBK7210691.1 hypothetical protein [Xanthomonadales bacterium]MBL0223105.1 hypothetical protein [Xanthomonadales bacterium]
MLRGVGVAIACVASLLSPAIHAADAADSVTGAQQMILVITPDWDSTQASLRRFEQHDGKWQAVSLPHAVVIGKSGAAWGLGLHAPQPGPQKREGDGRAPAGIFSIGPAFGYASSVVTGLDYHPMTAADYCIDVSDSPLYNQIVDAGKVGAKAIAGSTEPMRRDLHAAGDQRYKLGFVIAHNALRTPGGGSCIFAHLWTNKDSTTAGCTAMAEPVMRELLAWLDPARRPVFVLLPRAEYQRLRQTWRLPDLDDPAAR